MSWIQFTFQTIPLCMIVYGAVWVVISALAIGQIWDDLK